MSLLLLLRTSGRTLTLALGAGSFALAGQDTTGVLTEPLDYGAFTLAGEPAAFSRSRVFLADCGLFAFTGEPAGFTYGLFLTATYGEFILTGEPVEFSITLSTVQTGFAKFSWREQALRGISAKPAHATFHWKV